MQMSTHTEIHRYRCTGMHTDMLICTHTNILTYIQMLICFPTDIHTYMHIWLYVTIQIYTCIDICACMNTFTYRCAVLCSYRYYIQIGDRFLAFFIILNECLHKDRLFQEKPKASSKFCELNAVCIFLWSAKDEKWK